MVTMTTNELMAIKTRIKNTLAQRNGVGSVAGYAGASYDFVKPDSGSAIRLEHGQKTIDLLLKIVGTNLNRPASLFPELGTTVYAGGEIPEAFNPTYLNNMCNVLDGDVNNTTTKGGFRGTYNGVFYNLPGGTGNTPLIDANNPSPQGFSNTTEVTTAVTETYHCAAACTGVCHGSCIGQCNGCTGCSHSCGTGCAAGCTGCVGGCQGSCTGCSGCSGSRR